MGYHLRVNGSYSQMKKECPVCHKLVEEGQMIWLNGLNLCTECYKERRNMTDKEAYIKAVIKDIDNLILGAVKPLATGERARIFKAIIHSLESKLQTEGGQNTIEGEKTP